MKEKFDTYQSDAVESTTILVEKYSSTPHRSTDSQAINTEKSSQELFVPTEVIDDSIKETSTIISDVESKTPSLPTDTPVLSTKSFPEPSTTLLPSNPDPVSHYTNNKEEEFHNAKSEEGHGSLYKNPIYQLFGAEETYGLFLQNEYPKQSFDLEDQFFTQSGHGFDDYTNERETRKVFLPYPIYLDAVYPKNKMNFYQESGESNREAFLDRYEKTLNLQREVGTDSVEDSNPDDVTEVCCFYSLRYTKLLIS